MSYRIYGKAGLKAPSGIMSDQVGGTQKLETVERSSGFVEMSSRPNTKMVEQSESGYSSTSNPTVLTSKDSMIKDLGDLGAGSSTGVEYLHHERAENSQSVTGIEVKKSTDNIYY
jgi:hypothetical protein